MYLGVCAEASEIGFLRTLLDLQDLDLKIRACTEREQEIPKQKNKFDIYRKRLQTELDEREAVCKKLELEQRECEGDIEQKQEQIGKYNQQLNIIKKNEEYQALLHEIDLLKKQIAIREERILAILIEADEAKARLAEDQKRIAEELKDIDTQCAEIDAELAEAVRHREELEAQRAPLTAVVAPDLLQRYERIRKNGRGGRAVVPLNGDACGGCHMHERAQIVNEVMAGETIHACQHCGRLLYYPANFEDTEATPQGSHP